MVKVLDLVGEGEWLDPQRCSRSATPTRATSPRRSLAGYRVSPPAATATLVATRRAWPCSILIEAF